MSGRTGLPSGLVTFMFTDIEGSTRMARALGDGYRTVLGAHRAVIRAALRAFGGVELFTEGDSFFVAFRDATAAVSACVVAQRSLAAHRWPVPGTTPKVRMGLHTGWALPSGGEYASLEVHRAARVAAAAHGGQVLCSEATALAATACAAALPPAVWQPARSAQQRRLPGWPADGAHRAAPSGATATITVEEDARDTGPVPAPRRPGASPPAPGVVDLDLLDLGAFRLRGFDDSERLFQVVAAGLERQFPPPRTPGAAAHNLPAPVTAFVGRDAELAELTPLVGRHRLVTVTGAGGAGKTRLALAAARGLQVAYPQGVWLVDVAGAAELPAAVGAAVGLRPEPARPMLETVAEHCAAGRTLLVLDTCDARPAEAAALVRYLLARCPGLDVLATGRTPLGVSGEVVWRIPPLAAADARDLLAERAGAARGGRPVGRAELPDLARVAARLDGNPLALELAAARLRLLSPAQLAARLDDPLTVLDAGRRAVDRHDGIAANLDFSYRRLAGPAAALLRRLAVFAGPVELDAVEFCAPDALGALAELVETSLVDVVPGQRYRVPRLVRAYAARLLDAAGERRAVHDRHVDWALHTLERVAVDVDGQPRTVSLTEYAPYVAEWRAALRWSAAGGDARAGLRLAAALEPWWQEHGGAAEARDLLTRLYERAGDGVPPAALAGAYLVHAGFAADAPERDRYLGRAVAAARRARDAGLLARALAGRRVSLVAAGRTAEAERACRDAIRRAERAGVPGAALPAVTALAELLWRRGALTEAAELLGAARPAEAGRPEHRGRRAVDWLLGMVALRRGDLVAAHDHLVVALRSRVRHGFTGAAADAVAAIAVRCAQGGDPTTAAVLFGGADTVRGPRRAVAFAGFWAAQQAAVRITLGDDSFDAAYAAGAGYDFAQVVALAAAVRHPDLEQGFSRFALGA